MESFRVLILAAGKGTRMKSELPKVVHKIKDKPMITRVVEASIDAGAQDIVAIIGYKADIVRNELKNYNVKFAIQEEQLGTGHAVMMAKDVLKDYNGNIIILSGDVPLITANTIKSLYDYSKKNHSDCTIATSILEDGGAYGRIVKDDNGNVIKIVEAKDATEEELKIKEVNSGVYCFNSQKLFDALSKINTNNNQGEYYLTDTIEIIKNSGGKIVSFITDNPNEFKGVNTVDQLKELEQFI